MLRLSALLALVCAVWTQEERCCRPDIWQGDIHVHAGYILDGMPKMAFQMDFAAYDLTTKESAYYHNSYYPDGTSRSFRMVENYNTKKSYFIQDNTCHETELTGEMMKQCVPENATFNGPIFYGSGMHVLNADAFSRVNMNSDGFETGRELITVTREGCIPLETTRYHYTDARNSYMTGGTYADVRPEVVDREVFAVPSDCTPGAFPADLEKMPGYQLYKRVF